MEAIRRQVVGSLGKLLGGLDELAAPDDVSVRVIDGDLEAEGL